jgi:superfamily I DNA/RNA helicase
MIVVARAGTGKSSTIESIAPRGSVVLCFNKGPADEMAERLGSGRTASTFHKYGMTMLPKGSWLDKTSYNLKEHAKTILFGGRSASGKEDWSKLQDVENAVSWLKTQACLPNIDLESAKKVLTDDRLEFNTSVDETVEPALEVFQRCAQKVKGKFGNSGYAYNFDDMQWLPYVLGLGKDSVETLFIDEAQDLNPIRMALSLQWGQRTIAVGDDRQAIYAFNGSMSDSLSLFQKKTDAVALPLTVCWRCPSSHLDMARRIVPDIQDRPNCPVGELIETDCIEYDQYKDEGVLVMSRTNAPLIRHYLTLRKNKEQQTVFFASDGIALTINNLVGYDKSNTFDSKWQTTFNTKMDAKVQNTKSPIMRSVYADYREIIDELVNSGEFSNVEELHKFTVEEFKRPDFKDIEPNAIKLSSIHSSKGLEHNHAVLYGTSMLPHPMATMDWEKQQESNLEYVGLTRGKQSLTLIAEYY